MICIKDNLYRLKDRIELTAKHYGRNPKDIKIVAVSKNQSLNMILEAITAGQRLFGENYVKEATEKILQLYEYQNIQWHFIGKLQANKTRLVAENFSWCHTIEQFRIAQRLNNQRPKHLPPLNVLIEVNISQEQNKSGISLIELPKLAEQISSLDQLFFRGIMSILSVSKCYENQLIECQKIANAFHNLHNIYPKIDTLSIGMSNDLEAAVAAGSNLLRIGTAIFGPRNQK